MGNGSGRLRQEFVWVTRRKGDTAKKKNCRYQFVELVRMNEQTHSGAKTTDTWPPPVSRRW